MLTIKYKYKSKSRLKNKKIKDIYNNNQNNCIEDNNSMNKNLFYYNIVTELKENSILNFKSMQNNLPIIVINMSCDILCNSLIGIINTGNTFYINSSVQLMIHSHIFISKFMDSIKQLNKKDKFYFI